MIYIYLYEEIVLNRKYVKKVFVINNIFVKCVNVCRKIFELLNERFLIVVIFVL